MFEKDKEQKKNVWLVIKKTEFNSFESFSVAKHAYSMKDAISFKVSLENLNDEERVTYFIATETETAIDHVINLHNKKVANV